MGKHVILLNPSVLPRNGNILGQPCFVSGDILQFIIPAQETRLLDVVISGKVTFLAPTQNAQGTAFGLYPTEVFNIMGFNGKVGKLGIFSYLRLSRAYTGNVIESWPQLPLQLSFVGTTQHGSGFSNYNAGSGLQPWRMDTSFGTCRGNLIPNNDPTLAAFDNTAPVEDFYFSPPCGLLSDRKPKDLSALNGLQFDLQIANIGDSLQSVLPYKPRQDSDAPNVENNAAYGFVQLGNGTATLTTPPADIGILNPVMYYIVDDSPGLEASLSVTYVSVDLVRTQLIPSFSQIVSWPIARLLMKSILVFIMNKLNNTRIELGALTTCSMRTYDVQLFLNGARQIFAYNTSRGAVGFDWSQCTPNAFLQSLRTEPKRFYAAQRVSRGAFSIWDYDILGTGKLLSGINVVCNLTFQPWTKSLVGSPFNQLDGTTCLTLMPEFIQNYSYVQANRPVGTNGTTVPTTNNFAGYTGVDFNAQYTGTGTALAANPNTFPTQNQIDTSLTYMRKYNMFQPPTTDYQFVTTTLSSKTLIVNSEASVVVPEAASAKQLRFNPYLNLNHAAPQSSVIRVQELTLTTEIIPSPVPNTIGIRLLLPDNGILGKMYLNLPIRPANAVGLTLTGGFLTNATTLANFGVTASQINGRTTTVNAPGVPNNLGNIRLCWNTPLNTLSTVPTPCLENICWNKFGWSAVLGTDSIFKGLQWVLPENLAIQRFELQSENYLHRYAETNEHDYNHSRYTTKQTNAFFPSDLHSGALVDCCWARLYNHAYCCIDSVFPIYNSVAALSDMPISATQQIRLDIGTLDQTCRAMEGSVLCSSQKRYLDLFLDRKMIGLANHDCGFGGSKFSASELNSLRTTIVGDADGPLTLSNNIVMPSSLSLELIPGMLPTVTIQLVYHDAGTMTRLNETFKARGYQFSVAEYSFQRRFFATGKMNTISTPLGERIDLPIGGKNPSACFINHKALTWTNNELNLNIYQESSTVCSGIPPYIYARDGAFGYSIPGQILTNDQWATSPVVTYTPQIDNTLIYTFPFGTSITNAIGYALVHNKPLALTQHLVDFGSKRAAPVLESMFWTTGLRYTNSNVMTGIPGPINTPTRGANGASTYNVPVSPKTRSCYYGCPLLPSRFTTVIPILPEMQNGNLLSIYSNPTTYQTPSILGIATPTLTNAMQTAATWGYGQAQWLYPAASIRYIMREFAFPQSYTVWFNHNAATITYNFPTGQVVQ